ncbi:TetR/AcrR family transcriptional regulator [Waterburya agarophytonicola K14]|uniref:TetR/AcrR family transcriptional regulator n=1 Tax=Waterburya agarophytonicola KI4 TaxID=2874699 RepID=A0A964FIB0_9CYAN|nr:TetR/AcrR family transcriptional regulator [Waterburya agarophytonicola]MCC0179771.1 TetR/AcrR family transcriptional regulator [Waterburya agarophytonicola KI4]
MSKAQETKTRIIRQSAELFNLKGYAGSSMSDIMQATGLKKGGIYNHFASKEELALAAFDYAVSLLTQRVWSVVKTKRNAIDRLLALVSSYLTYIDNPPIVGGCPILNTAIETDDLDSPLRDRALQAINSWRDLIIRIIEKGIKKGEVRSTVEPDTVATIIICNIEGAMMMSKLAKNPIHMRRAIAHLQSYIKTSLV